ncbi:hypothetical protein BC831DRAFT_469250 [Entophlyctis helioformis]|nr:hypothetical protein BC831DRAFT_469250 [Entophlyctis helioformis]
MQHTARALRLRCSRHSLAALALALAQARAQPHAVLALTATTHNNHNHNHQQRPLHGQLLHAGHRRPYSTGQATHSDPQPQSPHYDALLRHVQANRLPAHWIDTTRPDTRLVNTAMRLYLAARKEAGDGHLRSTQWDLYAWLLRVLSFAWMGRYNDAHVVKALSYRTPKPEPASGASASRHGGGGGKVDQGARLQEVGRVLELVIDDIVAAGLVLGTKEVAAIVLALTGYARGLETLRRVVVGARLEHRVWFTTDMVANLVRMRIDSHGVRDTERWIRSIVGVAEVAVVNDSFKGTINGAATATLVGVPVRVSPLTSLLGLDDPESSSHTSTGQATADTAGDGQSVVIGIQLLDERPDLSPSDLQASQKALARLDHLKYVGPGTVCRLTTLEWSVPLFRVLIQAYATQNNIDRMQSLLQEMQERDLYCPNAASAVLYVICASGDMDTAGKVYEQHIAEGKQPTMQMIEAMIWGYLVVQYRKALLKISRSNAAGSPIKSSPSSSSSSVESPLSASGSADKRGQTDLAGAKKATGSAIDQSQFLDMDFVSAAVDRIVRDMSRFGFKLSTHIINSYLTHFMIRGMYDKVDSLYHDMEAQGIRRDIATYTTVIRSLFEQKRLAEVDAILERIDSQDGKRKRPLFVRDTKLYTTLIYGYANAGDPVTALRTYDRMLNEGVAPNIHTYHTLMTVYAEALDTTSLLRVWDEMVADGFQPTEITYSILVHAYGRSGEIRKAVSLVDHMRLQGLSLTPSIYNALMNAHIEAGNHAAAYRMYEQMTDDGIDPDVYTFTILFKSQVRQRTASQASDTLQLMLNAGVQPTGYTYSTLVQLYTATGYMDEAQRVFEAQQEQARSHEFIDPLPVLNRSMFIKAYALRGDWDAVAHHVRHMDDEAVPDCRAYEVMMRSLYLRDGLDGAVLWFERALMAARGDGLRMSELLALDEGRGRDAIETADEDGAQQPQQQPQPQPQGTTPRRPITLNVRLFNTMVNYYVRHGETAKALQVAEMMREYGVRPDIFTYTQLLKANISLSASGLPGQTEQPPAAKVADPPAAGDEFGLELFDDLDVDIANDSPPL